MFPRLFNDLKHCTIDALKECWVQYPHVQVTKPKTNLGKQLLERMCEDPATVLETTSRSRVWFWWSGLCNTKSNAIASTLTRRSCWLSNKLDAECHLAVFLVRQHLLLNFVTKNILLKESEMMLLYSGQQSKGFTSIIKLLNDMEKDWVNEQKKFQQLKITEKIQSINTQNACSSVNNGMDLQLVLKNSKQLWTWIQIREKIVRTELFFYWDTNKKTDVVQQPDLFKINGISHDKQLLNLCVLLPEHDLANDFVLLLSNKDAATKLLSQN